MSDVCLNPILSNSGAFNLNAENDLLPALTRLSAVTDESWNQNVEAVRFCWKLEQDIVKRVKTYILGNK